MIAGNMRLRRKLDGFFTHNCIEPASLVSRFSSLKKEMLAHYDLQHTYEAFEAAVKKLEKIWKVEMRILVAQAPEPVQEERKPETNGKKAPAYILPGDAVLKKAQEMVEARKNEARRTKLRKQLHKTANPEAIDAELRKIPQVKMNVEAGWQNALADATQAQQIADIAQLLAAEKQLDWLKQLAEVPMKNPHLCHELCRIPETDRLVMEILNLSLRKVDVMEGSGVYNFQKRFDPELIRIHDMMVALARSGKFELVLQMAQRLATYKHTYHRTPEFCEAAVNYAISAFEISKKPEYVERLETIVDAHASRLANRA